MVVRWLLMAAIASIALVSIACIGPGQSISAAGGEGMGAEYMRIAEGFARPWKVTCRGEECKKWSGIPQTAISLRTPEGVRRIEVTLSVTLGLQLSHGDKASIQATYVPVNDPPSPAPISSMAPGGFQVGPSGSLRTSTTLMWLLKGLPANGQEYHFQLQAKLMSDTVSKKAVIKGSPTVSVVEATW